MIPARFLNQLTSISEAIEAFSGLRPPNDVAHLVDIAARVDALNKKLTCLNKLLKNQLWEGNEAGAVLTGDMYEAQLTIYEALRFNQKKFQEERPRIFKQYQYSSLDSRTTFKPRS